MATRNFTMPTCPNCGGGIVGGTREACPYCGSPLPRPAAAPADDLLDQLAADPARRRAHGSGSETVPLPTSEDWAATEDTAAASRTPYDLAVVAFYQRLLHVTPRVPVTKGIVAANCVVFLLMAVFSGAVFAPDRPTLIAWGANYGAQTLGGEWWRLVTSTFVHIGVIHIALNMWVFWNLGQLVERLVGNVGFLVLYFVSGVFGSLTSVYWRPEVLSAGASGAVFGVFGALMGFIVLRSDSVPKQVLAELRNSGLTFLGYNLVFGFSIQGIDMAAHLGGLASGFLCGLVMSQRLDRTTWTSRTLRNLWVAGLGGGAVVVAVAFAPPAPADLSAELERFAEVQDRVIKAYQTMESEARTDKLSSEKFAAAIEQQILPPWRTLRERFEHLQNIPRQEQRRMSLMTQYLRARQESWEWLIKALCSKDQASRQHSSQQLEAKNEEWESLVRELNSLSKS
jgi:rhomboid protease GluP